VRLAQSSIRPRPDLRDPVLDLARPEPLLGRPRPGHGRRDAGRSRLSGGPAADTALDRPRAIAATRSTEVSFAPVTQSSRWSNSTRRSVGGFVLMVAA